MRPGMSDGRCFTTYLPNVQLNVNIQQKNKIMDNSTYRMFLQDNTDEIIENFQNVCKDKSNNECECFLGMRFDQKVENNFNIQPYDPNA